MTKEYFITEAQRVEVIRTLDTLAGTRLLANFFEISLAQQVIQPQPVEDPEAKKKSEPKAAKNDECCDEKSLKAKGKK